MANMKKLQFLGLAFVLGLIIVAGCKKKTPMAPAPAPQNTPTPLNTPTPAPTQVPLPTPGGFLGWLDSTLVPQLFWKSDIDPDVTDYELFFSTNGISYSSAGIFTKASNKMLLNDNGAGTTFDRYYYAISKGTRPDSSASVTVHAVSGVTTSDALTYSITAGATPTFSIIGGSVPGATNRSYMVVDLDTGNTITWLWSEGGAALTSVAYGLGGGVTYEAPSALIVSNNHALFVHSYNSVNWQIDLSITAFVP